MWRHPHSKSKGGGGVIGRSRSRTLCIGLLKGGTKLLKGGTKSWGWATGGGGVRPPPPPTPPLATGLLGLAYTDGERSTRDGKLYRPTVRRCRPIDRAVMFSGRIAHLYVPIYCQIWSKLVHPYKYNLMALFFLTEWGAFQPQTPLNYSHISMLGLKVSDVGSNFVCVCGGGGCPRVGQQQTTLHVGLYRAYMCMLCGYECPLRFTSLKVKPAWPGGSAVSGGGGSVTPMGAREKYIFCRPKLNARPPEGRDSLEAVTPPPPSSTSGYGPGPGGGEANAPPPPRPLFHCLELLEQNRV